MSAHQISAEEIESSKEFNEQFRTAHDFSSYKIYQRPIPKMHAKIPVEEKLEKYKAINDQFKIIKKLNEAIFHKMGN